MSEPDLNLNAPLSLPEVKKVAQVYEKRADHLELNALAYNTVLVKTGHALLLQYRL